MSLSAVFPGQGSQSVGMGKDLYETFPCAKEVFDEVDNTLNQHLSRLMFEGPADELQLTKNTQPALMAVSVASLKVLEKEGNWRIEEKASFAAGHSLGEYSALTAVQSLSLSDAASLLRTRGEAMQESVEPGQGAMAAILGLEMAVVQRITEEASTSGICVVANDNCQGQVVISGERKAIEVAVDLASQAGAKRSVILPVSSCFHSPLMKPASEKMSTALNAAALLTPKIPIISNITAQPEEDPKRIKELLVQQVYGMVRWRESVEYMIHSGISTFVEIGSGQVLSGLTKRISPDVKRYSLGTPKGIESFLTETN